MKSQIYNIAQHAQAYIGTVSYEVRGVPEILGPEFLKQLGCTLKVGGTNDAPLGVTP